MIENSFSVNFLDLSSGKSISFFLVIAHTLFTVFVLLKENILRDPNIFHMCCTNRSVCACEANTVFAFSVSALEFFFDFPISPIGIDNAGLSLTLWLCVIPLQAKT
jgi:hypothetical protein